MVEITHWSKNLEFNFDGHSPLEILVKVYILNFIDLNSSIINPLNFF